MKKLIVIAGPTASGKTDLSIRLAKHFQTAIISADSRQFFREMTIGTAKPTSSQLAQAPHHFINLLSITEEYNAGKFESEALNLLSQLFEQKKYVIMAGGSGLYINAVLYGFDDLPATDDKLRKQLNTQFQQEGIEFLQQEIKRLDPEYASNADLNNPRRLIRALEAYYLSGKPYSSFISKNTKKRDFSFNIYVLDVDRKALYSRINKRVDQMVTDGLFAEVTALYPFRHHRALQTVGYKEIFEAVESGASKEMTIEQIKKNTRNYAKRQVTWFRSMKNTVFVPSENAFQSIIERELQIPE